MISRFCLTVGAVVATISLQNPAVAAITAPSGGAQPAPKSGSLIARDLPEPGTGCTKKEYICFPDGKCFWVWVTRC
jgi:hypothetical protein